MSVPSAARFAVHTHPTTFNNFAAWLLRAATANLKHYHCLPYADISVLSPEKSDLKGFCVPRLRCLASNLNRCYPVIFPRSASSTKSKHISSVAYNFQ
jgi:hypothetical protein